MSGIERDQLARDELQIGWEQFAACAEVSPDIMFPEKGDMLGSRAAKAVCANCIVIDECLAAAIADPPKHGIRGGHTVHEIRELRREHGLSLAADRAAQVQSNYKRAVRMKQAGLSNAAIAKALGYAFPSGISELLRRPHGKAAS